MGEKCETFCKSVKNTMFWVWEFGHKRGEAPLMYHWVWRYTRLCNSWGPAGLMLQRALQFPRASGSLVTDGFCIYRLVSRSDFTDCFAIPAGQRGWLYILRLLPDLSQNSILRRFSHEIQRKTQSNANMIMEKSLSQCIYIMKSNMFLT